MRNHLLIAGTGRSGTSFLVRYLSALGLDTYFSRHGDAFWDDNANAGLENLPLLQDNDALPYVIKSPFLYQYIDELLASDDIKIDAVILPMRDLMEAAQSRVIVELRALYGRFPGMANYEQTWDAWAATPGGVIYSLNPLDEARILAVGFHQVVERLSRAGVPMLFLHFPRMIEDADHLYNALKPVLPDGVTLDAARAVHAQVADQEKVRVRPAARDDVLDNAALKREVTRLSAELAKLQARLAPGSGS